MELLVIGGMIYALSQYRGKNRLTEIEVEEIEEEYNQDSNEECLIHVMDSGVCEKKMDMDDRCQYCHSNMAEMCLNKELYITWDMDENEDPCNKFKRLKDKAFLFRKGRGKTPDKIKNRYTIERYKGLMNYVNKEKSRQKYWFKKIEDMKIQIK